MSILTIILFFIYIWGLGFTLTRKIEREFWEKQVINLGVGLGVFPILSIMLNFLRVPLDWRIFLALSLLYPVYFSWKHKFKLPKFSLKLKKSHLYLIAVLAIFFFTINMYTTGAFSYNYLENEDPWGHAVGVKYVSLEKSAFDPVLTGVRDVDPVLSYIDPYPPAYNILMGVLHQTSPDLTWTLKFFNALIISLSIFFFFIFAKSFMGNESKALLATFILAMIPSYLSHFIWAHSLVITLVFPTLLAFVLLKDDKKWFWIATLLVASIWVTQNVSQPLKISTMLLLFIIVASVNYRTILKRHVYALVGGVLISFIWWGSMVHKYGLKGFASFYNVGSSYAVAVDANVATSRAFSITGFIKTLVAPGGSASRAYTFSDFVIAQKQNMINNPIGVGIVISALVLLAVVFILWKKSALLERKNTWLFISMFWLVFTFWGVNGQTFPVSVARGPFRVWMLMAIPLSILAAEGIYHIKKYFPKGLRWVVIGAILVGVIFTSGVQKYELNTTSWPTSGSFAHPGEAAAYGEWFSTLEDDTHVFLYSPRDKLTIGFGKFSCSWCQEVINFREDILSKSVADLHAFLISQDYSYLVINHRMDSKYLVKEEGDAELLQQKYQEIIDSGFFIPVYQVEGVFVVFQVNA